MAKKNSNGSGALPPTDPLDATTTGNPPDAVVVASLLNTAPDDPALDQPYVAEGVDEGPGKAKAKKTVLHAVDTKSFNAGIELPITVGNPLNAADFAISQEHLEESTTEDSGPAVVVCGRPPKGVHFTTYPETGKPWVNREFYYLLEMKDHDPYIVAPHIAKQKNDEDVIRPVLLVRFVTMNGTEGLWPLKVDTSERSNSWNKSAMNILKIADEGRWLRMMSAKKEGQYVHKLSKKTLETTPRPESKRTFKDMVNSAFSDRVISSLDHEVWDILDNGSDK
jgi:hypothetical protein